MICIEKYPFKRYIATEAAVGAAASIIGAGTSAAAQASMNKKTREFNREEAEKQRQWSEKMYNEQNAWNYEMWQKEQDYNDPVNQLQRLRDAGLNPLYYGLDGNTTGQAQEAAQPLGYDRASADNQVNPVSAGLGAAAEIAQISNIQANTAKQKQETLTEVQKRERIQADIVLAKQELNNMLANEQLSKSQRAEIEQRISWLDRLNEATIAEKEANAALNKAQKNRIEQLLEGEKLLQSKSLQDFDEKWKKIRAEIGKIAKETGLLEKDIENYALNHASNGFMGTGLSLQNLFRGAKSLGDTISENPNVSQGKSILAEDNR